VEVGSTWVGSLAAIGALRPFTPEEIAATGGKDIYLDNLWLPGLTGDATIWSLPFLADTRVIYYWRDLFADAGIDEKQAFQNFDALQDTLNRLTPYVNTPWAVLTSSNTHDILYPSASWVWGAGGDFFSPEGNQVLFAEPEALRGLEAYFSLHPYIPVNQVGLNGYEANDLFVKRRVAALIGGPWLRFYLMRFFPENMLDQTLGVALPPGPAFVGGSHLAIMQHTSRPEQVMDAVRTLISEEFACQYWQESGLFPAQAGLLDAVRTQQRPFQVQPFLQAIRTGRNPALQPRWALVEHSLTLAYGEIWAQLAENPDWPVEDILRKTLTPLADRLNRLLGAS
jgi:ABC-type glycerol-3-phosphate transport system substrate-binding protein